MKRYSRCFLGAVGQHNLQACCVWGILSCNKIIFEFDAMQTPVLIMLTHHRMSPLFHFSLLKPADKKLTETSIYTSITSTWNKTWRKVKKKSKKNCTTWNQNFLSIYINIYLLRWTISKQEAGVVIKKTGVTG